MAECLVSVAMYATIKVGGPIRAQRIPMKTKLLDDVTFLSQLLRYEFVYEAGGMNQNLDTTLEKLVLSNVVVIGKDEKTQDLWVTLSSEERRTGRETFGNFCLTLDFYCFLLWPFIETYWLCAVSLYTILPDKSSNPSGLHWIDSRAFIDRSQVFGKTLYFEGDVSYFESVNKETMANAIGWLRHLGIIKVHKGADPPSKSHYDVPKSKTNSNTIWIAISSEWCPAENLPDAGPPNPDTYVKKKSDWDGPLGNFTSTVATSLYGNSSPELPSNGYYDSETSSIEQLHGLSALRSNRSTVEPALVKLEEPDHQHVSWLGHRPSGKLWDFCEQIGRFRREGAPLIDIGKNRRDTATVAIRVLRLAQIASQWTNGSNKITKAQL